MSNEPPPMPPPMPPAFPPPDEGPGGFGSIPPPPPAMGGGGGGAWPPPPGGPGGDYGLPEYNLNPSNTPWESEQGGWFSRWWQTTKMVLLQPTRFFDCMQITGGTMPVLKFAIVAALLCVPAQLLCQSPMMALQFLPQIAGQGGGQPEIGMVIGFIAGFFCLSILLLPLTVTISLYLWSGILHLSLMLVGGARNGFEATFRPVAYVTGASYLPNAILGALGSIPLVSCITAPIAIALSIYVLVIMCMGLIKAHGCEVWQAVVAIIIPMLLCCGLIFLTVFSVIAMVAANQ